MDSPAGGAYPEPEVLHDRAAPRAGSFEWDRRTGKVSWSPALEALHGLAPGTFGGTIEAFLADAHPDDRARVEATIHEVLRHPGQPFTASYRIVRPDGTVGWIEAHGEVPVAEDGAGTGIRGICMDISRQRASTRLREAAYAVNHALAQADEMDAGIAALLAALGTSLEGAFAAWWAFDPSANGLRLHAIWQSDGPALDAFIAASRDATFHYGEGLPGRAWARGLPIWIENASADESLIRRRVAAPAGLQSCLAFPVRDGTQTVGVVEWFGRDSHAPDRAILDGLQVIASDASQFIARLSAERRLAARERQQAAVAGLGRLALDRAEQADLFDAAVTLLAEALDVDCTKILRLLPGDEELLLTAGLGWHDGLVGQATVGADGDSQAGYTLTANAPVIVKDLRTEQRFRGPPLLTNHGVISGMSTVIRGRDGAWGVLGAHTTHERTFSDDDAAFLESVANVLASAIERDQREQEQAFLLDAGGTLFSSLDYRETLRKLADLAVTQIADWCVIHLVDEDLLTGGESPLRPFEIAHRDPSRSELVAQYRQRLTERPPSEMVERVVRTGRTALVADVSTFMIESSGLPRESIELLRSLDVRSTIVAPLLGRERVLGAIVLVSAESRRRYTSADVAFAEELGRRAGLAIDNARLYEQTRDALRTREDFVSLASHELRSPLTSILGLGSLIARRAGHGGLDESTKESLAMIHIEAQRMHRTLELLLDMAVIDTGRFTVHVEPADLVELVTGEARLVGAREPHAVVDARFPPAAVTLSTDATRVQTIVMNLLSNAVKYGGDPPRVSVAVEASEGGGARVRVRDNGNGIGEADQQRVFERYFRSDGAQRSGHHGLGLGLYLSKQIADRLGATLSFQTEAGAGTEFVLELPAAAPVTPERSDD